MRITKPFITLDFNSIKEAKWWLIDAVVVASFAWVIWGTVPSTIYQPVGTATLWLVNSVFLDYLVALIIIVFFILMVAGKMKSRDIGIQWKLLPQAIFVVLVFWALLQLCGILINQLSGGHLGFSSHWAKQGLTISIGEYIGQFFGCTPFEEIIFRGFLLPQIFLKLQNTKLQNHTLRRLIISLVISQMVFALWHIPRLVSNGDSLLSSIFMVLYIFAEAILLSLIYLRTGNLFITMSIHAMINLQNLFCSYSNSFIAFIIVLIPLIIWLLLTDFSRNRILAKTPA
jgi:uncharacterized protein